MISMNSDKSKEIVTGRRTNRDYVYGAAYDPDLHIPLLHQVFNKGEGIHAFCAKAGIKRSTFDTWRKKHIEFQEAYEIALSAAASIWERYPIAAMENGTSFNFKHWEFVMKSRGYHKNDSFQKVKKCLTVEEKLNFIWNEYIKGSISSDEYSKIVTAITGGLKAKELEISARELDMKAKELEYQKEHSNDMSKISDEALEAYMLVKSGKGKVVKDE